MDAQIIKPFVLPVVFNLVVIFLAWIYYANRKTWPHQPAAHGKIYRCAACGHVYVEARDVPMSLCPQCGRFNEAVKR